MGYPDLPLASRISRAFDACWLPRSVRSRLRPAVEGALADPRHLSTQSAVDVAVRDIL